MLTSGLVSVIFLLNFHGMGRRHEKHPDDIARSQHWQGAGYAEQSQRTRYITYISGRQKSNRVNVPQEAASVRIWQT